jgi:hypothetical protein
VPLHTPMEGMRHGRNMMIATGTRRFHGLTTGG